MEPIKLGSKYIFLLHALELRAVVIISLLLGLTIFLITVYICDRVQKKHIILRNFPIIGHFRYISEYLGEFFRQYFFSNDREEFPFNRAIRNWVYRAAKNIDTTVGFGSTRPLNETGTLYFVSAPFPPLEATAAAIEPVTIGPYCKIPYTSKQIFNISAMSFGAISKPAIQILSHGAKLAGCWLNTGEGGVSPYHLEYGCDLVVQIGTAKYGVRNHDGSLNDKLLIALAEKPEVKMFEIKLSQGAKPGKGGLLPAIKVTEEVARIRGIPAHEDSISPNRHPDIGNVEELLNAIAHIREVTGKPVGCKFVLGSYEWLDDFCRQIHKRGILCAPDFITLDSADGGTGAAPQGLMDYMGIPISESLPRLVDILNLYNLKKRIKVIASGKLVTPAEVAWAICVGADFVNSARGFMLAMGCIQALKCHNNTCPTGITSHNPKRQRGLVITDKVERIRHYANNMAHEITMICHSCGITEPRQLKRAHARIVTADGVSESLATRFPDQVPMPEFENVLA